MSRFSTTEWSGPAWYKVKLNKDGFPIQWDLVYFVAADLGHFTSTEYHAKDIAIIAIKTLKNNPKLKNDKTYMGMIHSHHNMGAYHSGTDEDTLQEMVPNEGFFGSLVVSSTVNKENAFAFSYRDQYKNITIINIDDVEVSAIYSQEFSEEADAIERLAKINSKNSVFTNNRTQGNFSYDYTDDDYSKMSSKSTTKKNIPTDVNFPNPTDWEKYQEMEDIILSHEKGELSFKEADELFREAFGIAITDYYDLDNQLVA